MRARVLAVLTILLVARLAGATAADVPAKDRPAYLKAVKLQNAGDWAAALAAFEALPPTARDSALARIHMAECKRRLGRWREAAADLAKLAGDTSLDPASREVAASDLTELRANIPKIVVSASAQDLTIRVGDTSVAPPATLEVDPGEYRVEAKRVEKLVFSRDVVATVGKTIEIFVDVDTAPSSVTPPVVAVVPATPQLSDRSTSTWAYVAIAGGAVFGGIAVYSYSRAVAADDGLKESCLRFCDEDLRAERGRWNTVTVTAGILGTVGIATGVALLIFRSDNGAPAVALTVSPRNEGAIARVSVAF